MACASAGIVIGIVLQTGLALRFTAFLVDFTYGSLLPALLITMVAGIVLGMGMPTTPAYIMQAALLVPAIIKLGVEPMAAHMFAFYFSCLSAVTPPVALAVYAAASIGGAGLWGSGVQAVKFAAAGFIVPFFFVYNPALLVLGAVAGDPARGSHRLDRRGRARGQHGGLLSAHGVVVRAGALPVRPRCC